MLSWASLCQWSKPPVPSSIIKPPASSRFSVRGTAFLQRQPESSVWTAIQWKGKRDPLGGSLRLGYSAAPSWAEWSLHPPPRRTLAQEEDGQG